MRSTLVLIGIAAILLFCLLCYVCFRIACVRSQNVDRTRDAIPEGSPLFPYRDRFLAAGEMLDGLETQGWDIESFDGLRLHGEFFDANSEKTIINAWDESLNMSLEMIQEAYEAAAGNAGIRYCNGILKSWAQKKYRTPADIQEEFSQVKGTGRNIDRDDDLILRGMTIVPVFDKGE